MSYDISNIINITTRISPKGLAVANFASFALFAPESELPATFATDTRKVYSSITELSKDFASTTEVYKAAAIILGGIPSSPREITVYGVADADADWSTTLNKARDSFWWMWSCFTKDVYADAASVEEIAAWCEINGSIFINCQTGASATAIRDINTTNTIANTLTTGGYRRTFTFAHATEDYAGFALAKHYAAVNYSAANSTITGEYKKLSNVSAEDLLGSEQSAMSSDAKKVAWYAAIELKGSVDSGRVINTVTHSSYGEFIDDVVNLEALINACQVGLYNTVANSTTKLGQTIRDQQILIGQAKLICNRFIDNGYLGERNYTDPDTGLPTYSKGFEILTKAEDILLLSDEDRAKRKSAPLKIRLHRKGAIQAVDATFDIY